VAFIDEVAHAFGEASIRSETLWGLGEAGRYMALASPTGAQSCSATVTWPDELDIHPGSVDFCQMCTTTVLGWIQRLKNEVHEDWVTVPGGALVGQPSRGSGSEVLAQAVRTHATRRTAYPGRRLE
jgi:hypothetical protein